MPISRRIVIMSVALTVGTALLFPTIIERSGEPDLPRPIVLKVDDTEQGQPAATTSIPPEPVPVAPQVDRGDDDDVPRPARTDEDDDDEDESRTDEDDDDDDESRTDEDNGDDDDESASGNASDGSVN